MTVRAELYDFGKAASLQARVSGALVLREMRVRFGRSQLGYLWAVAEPIAYMLVFSMMFYFMGRHPPVGNSMPLFFATGILPFMLFRNLGTQLAGAFDANRALMTYPIVQPIDTVLGRAALEIATSLFIMLIVLSALVLLAGAPLPVNILRMGEAILLLSIFGFGTGLLNAVIIDQLGSWQNTFRILMMPMMFISGVFFSFESLPPNVREVLAWNPVLHGVELFRSGYYASFRATGLSAWYLFGVGISVSLFALVLERLLRGRSSQ